MRERSADTRLQATFSIIPLFAPVRFCAGLMLTLVDSLSRRFLKTRKRRMFLAPAAFRSLEVRGCSRILTASSGS